VTAALAADVMMPSVRAYMVLAAAGDHGAVIHAVPGKEDVDSFDGRTVVAWVTSDHETEVLQAAIAAVPDVASAVVEELAAGAPAEAAPEATGTQRAEDAAAPSKRTSSTVRVDAERLDALMHLMGELVVDRTAVESLAQEAQLPALTEAVAGLTRSSQALQALVMQVRMIPVEAVFMRFPRLVRDLSGSTSTSSSQEPRRSSTAPWSTPSATHSSTSSATRSTTRSSRRTSAARPESPRPGRSRSAPATPAVTW
jgi:two-component system chemotaxis sensor kinase CheA